MVGCGADLRSDSDGWGEAHSVTAMTMRRARDNVERVLELLSVAGYQFAPGEGLPTYEPPHPDVVEHLDELEAEVGVLPLALRGSSTWAG